MATPDSASHTNKDPTRKDLIHIKNAHNGRTYKFACGTCISGHRAPQCDPVKHYDKILFRRPDPGRPAKNCGHPASVGCNCKGLRRLCCFLNEQQWKELKAGGVPTATMYDDEDALNEAMDKQKALIEQARAQVQVQEQERALQAANFYGYQQLSLSYQPTPQLTDMPFVHPGQMDPHNQYMAYHPVPQPQYDFYGNGFSPATFQPEYNPQFQPAAIQPAAIQPQYQTMAMQADTTPLQQFATHMAQEKQIAAQPSANPTKSCCSSRPQAKQPLMQPTSSQFNIPGSYPRSQFGCPNCASFECTCVECPELGQGASGAWSQMCGRGGELGGDLDGSVLLKQEYSSSQTPQNVFQGIPEYQAPLQDFSQGLPEYQAPQQNFSQQPCDVFQHPQEVSHYSQGLPRQPQDVVFHQSQELPEQPQDAFQGLSELQAPLEDYSQLPSADVQNLPEFQFGQPQPTFDEALSYDNLSDVSVRW